MLYEVQKNICNENGGYRIADLGRKFDVSFLVGIAVSSDYDMHIHTVLYEFLVFLKGNVEYFVNGSKKKLKRGDVVVASPGEIHKPYILGNAEEYERIVFHISENLLEEYSTLHTNLRRHLDGHAKHFYHFSEKELEQYVAIAESINRVMKDPEALGTDILVQSYHQLLLIRIMRKIQETDQSGGAGSGRDWNRVSAKAPGGGCLYQRAFQGRYFRGLRGGEHQYQPFLFRKHL